MRKFDGKLAALQTLLQIWENGSDAVIQDVSTEVEVSEDTSVPDNSVSNDSVSNDSVPDEGSPDEGVSDDRVSHESVPLSNSVNIATDVSNIRLPPKVKKRGRPKGSELTVIGLPKKRKVQGKPVAFIQKHSKEKERIMLEWFVSSSDTNHAMSRGILLEEETVETRPEKISNCCIDENVNIYHIKKYFTHDAWQVILQVLQVKKEHSDWFCKVCNKELEDTSIACDSCLNWHHLSCSGLKKAPKKSWFCRLCYEQAALCNDLDD